MDRLLKSFVGDTSLATMEALLPARTPVLICDLQWLRDEWMDMTLG